MEIKRKFESLILHHLELEVFVKNMFLFVDFLMFFLFSSIFSGIQTVGWISLSVRCKLGIYWCEFGNQGIPLNRSGTIGKVRVCAEIFVRSAVFPSWERFLLYMYVFSSDHWERMGKAIKILNCKRLPTAIREYREITLPRGFSFFIQFSRSRRQ